jgi:hypothetical protein
MFDINHPGTTDFAEPWVLIRFGGQGMLHTRERTRLAYLTRHVTDKPGYVLGYRLTRLIKPTKHAYQMEEKIIVHRCGKTGRQQRMLRPCARACRQCRERQQRSRVMRRAAIGAVVGIVFRDAADWQRWRRRHELSHHIAGRGGG